jgi:hypothetical protein
MPPLRLSHCLVALLVGLGASAHAAEPEKEQASTAKPAAGGYREINWDELIPKGWDPMQGLRDKNVGALNDSDPKVLELMRQLREIWDTAPVNDAMNGAAVKLPGYVVPLDEADGALKEFLLVPYFGACIHSPPPPANQIVHVVASKPIKGFRSMDAVWVSGTLQAQRKDSAMGASGYTMNAALVQAYTGKR